MKNPAKVAPGSGPTITARQAEVARLYRETDWGSEAVAAQLRKRGFPCSSKTVRRDARALGIARPEGRPPKYPPPPTDRTCPTCGGPVRILHPSWAAQRGGGVYCKNECRRIGAVVACPQCGKERYRPPSHIGKGFCSHSCWGRYLLAQDLGRLRGFARSNLERFGSTKLFGKLGGRPRGYTEEQAREVVKLRNRNRKLGERAIAARVGLSKRQVHEILVDARSHEVVRNPS